MPSPAQLEAIRGAIASGNKIEAVKLTRAAMRCGLKEAKDVVDRLEAGVAESEAFAISPGAPETGPNELSQVRAALAAGNKIEAIRLYRELTGFGLAEAKEAVERLASEGIPTIAPVRPSTLPSNAPVKSGCTSLLTIALLLSAAAAALAWVRA
jgi:ribosomal protein L7/L12